MRQSSRVQAALLLSMFAGAASWPAASAPIQEPGTPIARDSGRYSDAEKAYDPPAATTRIADGRRNANLQVSYGRKFSPTPGNQLTITNGYLDLDKVFFVEAVGLIATADGGLLVGGRAGLDRDSHAVGTGYWRIAADGAVTPSHTRSTNTFGKTPATKCDAPYARTHLAPENFAAAPGGGLVKTIDYAVVKIGADGIVRRVAGAPLSCEESGQASQVRGFVDGAADVARFNMLTAVVADPEGNIWVVDQQGCALRRIGANGQVTTVISIEQACGAAVPMEDRVGLDNLAWDAVHGELVSAWSRPVARPVHNLYTTVWRTKPTGEFRRVLYGTKVGASPARHLIDGISSMAVDPQGRIHVASRIMRREGGSVLAVLRVDEAGATVVPVTGGKIGPAGSDDEPRDGPAGLAQFRYLKSMSFGPDGTLYLLDEHLVRKLDRAGQVSTWAF